MTTPTVKPINNESYEQYLLRLGSEKEELELSWGKIASLMNEFTNEDFTEFKYRKEYHLLKRGVEIGVKDTIENDQIQELEDKTVELQKQKYQFQDQKRELNNKIRQIARFEHMKNEVEIAIKNLEKIKPLQFKEFVPSNTKQVRANVLWSDFHYSQESDNSVNTYNRDVFKRRFKELVSKTIYYCKKHDVTELTIGQIGDMIAGFIHTTSRIETNEDVIEQTMNISEYLAEAIVEISNSVQGLSIRVINIFGNHSRTTPNKQESIIKENFERLIPWHLETRLRDMKNVEILVGNNEGYYLDESFKKPQCYMHGDHDYISSVAKTFPQYLGVVPKYIWMGHYHNDSVKDFGRTTVVGNGSLCGTDSYASGKRLYADAMQKMHVFSEDENIEYTIHINLQNV